MADAPAPSRCHKPAPQPEHAAPSAAAAASAPSAPSATTTPQGRLRQWMAERLLRDEAPDTLIETLVTAGFDRQAGAAALAAMTQDPVFVAARRVQQGQRKLEAVAGHLQQLWQRSAHYTRIEKREDVPADEFVERYLCGCRPVVITGLAREWPALQRWTPAGLEARLWPPERGRATWPSCRPGF